MDIPSKTTLASSHPSSWRHWTLRQWSQALFRHFFEYEDEDTPVTRLVITDATWSTVTGDASTLPAEIQQAFLDQFPRTRRELNRHLSSEAIQLPLHDLFPYLILTCLVAAVSEEVTEAGQFRQRLTDMLETWDFAPLPLTGFGKVWEEFRKRLEVGRNQGYPWRQLKLPADCGRETLIGYSKRLAFPSRNDQQQLAPLLNTLDKSKWLDEPPVYPVLNIVERHLWKFSSAFQQEFRDFKSLVSSGQETAAHPFWAAVLGVLRANPSEGRARNSRRTLDLCLLMEFDEFEEPVLSLLSKTSSSPWSSIASQPLELEIAGYTHLLIADENPEEPARRLLNGGLSRSDVRSSLLEVAQDGLLIFQREGGYRIARTRPPESGPATVLVRQDLKDAFVSALGSLAFNRPLKPCLNTRWHWLEGLESQQIPRLPGIRCLTQVARSASISVYDGIRCQGGSYLSRFAALPEFRLEGSHRFRLNRLSTASTSAKALALDQGKTGWRLAYNPETRARIEGEFEVIAENRAGTRMSARRIRFQREVLTWNYGWPSDPTAWEIEAGQRDTASLAVCDRPLWEIGAAWNPEQCLETTALLPVNEPDPGWSYTGVGDLIEALAAIGTTRTLGLAEMEFLDFLRRFLHIDEKDYRLLWDIARAWMEAGLLQRVSDRRWRNVRYLPQIPRLCLSRTSDGAWRGVVIGLISTSPGQWLANAADGWQEDVEAQWVASISPWLPPGLVLTGATAEALIDFAKAKELEVVVARSLVDALASLDQAVQDDDPPGNYSLYAVWNWEQGRFQKFTDAHPPQNGSGVFWHRRERGDRRDYFVARAENGRTLWSYSRVWSLLAGARLLGRETYGHQPGEGLVRRAAGGIHLPTVVGRLAFALSGCASGPVKNADGSITYRYPLVDDAQVEWVGAQLLGWVRRSQEQGRIPEWLRALMMAQLPVEPHLLLPTNVGSAPISSSASLLPLYRHFINLNSKQK